MSCNKKMDPGLSHKFKGIFERHRKNEQRFRQQSQNYIIELDKLKSMHSEVATRQTDLIGICQSEPAIISKYFVKYKPLSFNSVSFKDLAQWGGPKMAFNNGKMYIGSIVEGKRHGKGLIACPKGKVYEGELINNERNGSGVEIYERGSFYIGGFSKNKRSGKGIMVWVDEQQVKQAAKYQYYNGEWKEGDPNGFGLHQSNNIVYLGQFKAGIKHGQALELVNGEELYEGTFANGHRQGKGFLFSPKDQFYQGDYKAGLKHGYGLCFSFQTYEEYEGFFQRGKKDGIGLYQRQHHFSYRGMFTDDKPNGNGEFINYMTEAHSVEKDMSSKHLRTQERKKTQGLRKKVDEASEQLKHGNNIKPRKVNQTALNKPTSLFNSHAEKSKETDSFAQRKWLSSAKLPASRPQHSTATPTNPETQSKCKYRSCSCNNWQNRSQNKSKIDQPRLKRLFSSRKIILKQVVQ